MFDIESKNRDINSWSVVCVQAFAILAFNFFSSMYTWGKKIYTRGGIGH